MIGRHVGIRSVTILVLCGLIVEATPVSAQTSAVDVAQSSVTVDGARISYRVAGDGPPLMLIHGFTLTASEWDPFLENLSQDFTVILPDLPGHGSSEWLPGEFSYRATARAMFAILDDLGIDRVRAIGHSAGGNTLVHMATQQPDRIEAMVLVAGGHRLTAGARQVISEFRVEAVGAFLQDFYRRYHPGREAQLASIFRELRSLSENYDDFDFSPERLATVPARTLLVWGDRDPFYPLEIGVEMYEAMPNASLWVLPEQGHSPIWVDMDGTQEAQDAFPIVVRRFFTGPGVG